MSAWAAKLGPLNVMSEFGQPLRAVVEITDVAPGERLLVEASVAPLDTYMTLGLPYPDSLRDANVRVLSLNDGRWVLRIAGVRAVEEKDFNMVLALDTAEGRQVRNYRLTHDALAKSVQPADVGAEVPVIEPAPLPQAGEPGTAPAPIALPEVPGNSDGRSGAAVVAADAAAGVAPAESTQAGVGGEPLGGSGVGAASGEAGAADPVPVPSAAEMLGAAQPDLWADQPARPAKPGAAPLTMPAASQTVTVAPGDTATAIAGRIKPEEATSEQALLALYRLNAQAFDGNIHRLRAGTVLQVPGPDQMSAIPVDRAREELRSLTQVGAPMPAVSRDELRLSQGGKGGSTATEGSGGGAAGTDSKAVQAVAIDSAMSEVQSRIKQLESIVNSLNALIAAREQQVAKVQAEIAAMGIPVTDVSSSADATPEAPADQAEPGLALGAANATLMRSSTREEVALQTALAAEENAVPSWVKILAGVAAMSLGLAVLLPFVFMRRRRSAAGSDAETDEEDEDRLL